MSKKNYIVIGTILASFALAVGFIGSNIRKIPGLSHADPFLIQLIIMIIGIIAAAVAAWIMSKQDKKSQKASGGGEGEAAEEVTDLNELLAEAEARLAVAQQEKDSKIFKLPAVLLIGEAGSAKTTTMVHSGAEPESLSGQVYEENNILPTPTANIWFARHTVFVEMAGKLLGDSDSWKTVIKHLQPPKTAALLGTAGQVPRAALVCVDAEMLNAPSPDPMAVLARKLRGQLAEISRLLGINLPVYVLFTRSDRLLFFTEYVSKLNNDEATRIIGATLPIVEQRQGIYAEQETNRLGAAFEKLFRSLCHARPTYLARETEPMQLAGIYEFPREFRKIHQPLVRFLVELCRPSQITVGPFLRGFYFSGVRPIVVNELAPAAPVAPAASAGGKIGATSMFRARGGGAEPAAAQRIVGTKKVPQWLFLGHFFNDLILGDQTAKGASASSIRASMPRRILLMTAAVLCLLYSIALIISFGHNKALATDVKQASAGIASVSLDASGGVANLDSLQKLEALRQSLETLTKYKREGAPLGYRWGLYIGNDLYPDVHKLYFADFRKLLLAPTQDVMVAQMRALPGTPGPTDDYTPPYKTLKAYLETTSNHEKAAHDFLPPVLLDRWSANRNVDAERMRLAQKQFDFYTEELKLANPYASDNDAAVIGNARHYLAQFGGIQRVYQAMLADAGKTGQPINFNKKFPGSEAEVVDNYDVAAAFSKPGWDFMKAALRDPGKYFEGEAWVLGPQSNTDIDRTKLAQQLASLYYSDFVKQWRNYIKAASVVRYTGMPDAAKKLSVISGNQSPLLELFALASQNTAVDAPDVAKAFQPVQTVTPPTNVDRYIAPSNQAYMTSMVNLQGAVDAAAQQTPPSDAAAATTQNAARDAHNSAKQVAQAFSIDPEVHLETQVQKLMEDPITYVDALVRNIGPEQLNGAGRTMCGQFRTVTSKFPFNPNATPEATLDDVASIFKKPDGALWKFYNDNLVKYLPLQGSQYVGVTVGGVSLTPGFVSFFNQAANFSNTLYAGGTDPHFTYTLKPAPSDGIESVEIHLDGQPFSETGGQGAAKEFVWKGSGAHDASGSMKPGGFDFATGNGLWAIFRFFYRADTWRPVGGGNILEWNPRSGKDGQQMTSGGKPVVIRVEVDMGGSTILQKGYLARMACVAEVAK